MLHYQLPDEIWEGVLNKLLLTDLALISGINRYFRSLVSSCIKTFNKRAVRFAERIELKYEGVSILPAIHVNTSQMAMFNQMLKAIQVCHIPSGELISSHYMEDLTPLSISFSETGEFLSVCFDSMIKIYTINRSECKPAHELLNLYHEFFFDIPIMDFVVPAFGTYRYGMGRILHCFSKDDKHFSVAHISERNISTKWLEIKFVTCTIYPTEDNYEEENSTSTNASETKQTFSTVAEEMNVFWMEVEQKDVSINGIELNAKPLRFLVQPGCVSDAGLLLDPNNGCPSLQILHICPQRGELVKLMFSPCEKFLIDVREKYIEPKGKVYVVIVELDTVQEVNCFSFEKEEGAVLDVLLSANSRLAIIIIGRLDRNRSEIYGWHTLDLVTGASRYVVRRDTESKQSQEFFHNSFCVSFDGQIISTSCHREKSNTVCRIKLYETATGCMTQAVTSTSLMQPNGSQYDEWSNPGKSGCSHMLGGTEKSMLTMFSTCEPWNVGSCCGVAFSFSV